MKYSIIKVDYYEGKTKKGKDCTVCKICASITASDIQAEIMYQNNFESFLEFTGKAVRNEEDAPSNDGRKVAFAKAKEKMFMHEMKTVSKLKAMLFNELESLERNREKASMALLNETKFIEKLSK